MNEVTKAIAILKTQIATIEGRIHGETFEDEEAVASLVGVLTDSATAVRDAVYAVVESVDDLGFGVEDEGDEE